MNILLTGCTGALARPLAAWLQYAGHEVVGVSRKPEQARLQAAPSMPIISWEQLKASLFITQHFDAIINMAGAPMMQRWNTRNKAAILHSRLDGVRALHRLLRELPEQARPECVIHASSVSIYSSCALPVDEFSAIRPDYAFFQSQVWLAVERLIDESKVPGVRTLITRLGLVIGADALMDRMLRLSRCWLGSVLGDGLQRISWVARRDMLRAIIYLLVNRQLQGVFNLVSGRPITAEQLGAGIARCVDRKALLRVPAAALHVLLGELASNFLTSADVMPARLQIAGFNWELPDFEHAIQAAAQELGYRQPDSDAVSKMVSIGGSPQPHARRQHPSTASV